MCGISGIFATDDLNGLNIRIGRMCDSMSHRGPNASGTLALGRNVALGHCRLSIIDLQNISNQPMCSNDGRYYIVFNGEIVNYREIKKQIAYDYRTGSDTEVILAAVTEKGLPWLLEHADGMFAFILYDTVTKDILLARDRYGIKPMFYTLTPEKTLIVASEIKGVLNSGLIDAKLNQNTVDDFFAYRYVREPNTLFQNIFQVPHASYIKFDAELNCETICYYSMPEMNFKTKYDERELERCTADILVNTINKWSVADVKVGAFLSGGVDSGILSAVLACNTKNVNTYTIGFPDEGTNEFSYAKAVADKYSTNHHAYTVDIDTYFQRSDGLMSIKDAPLGVPNEILLSILTGELCKDITVVLSGEGADELFGGYGRIYRSAFDYESADMGDATFFQYFTGIYEYVPRWFRDKYLFNASELSDYRYGNDRRIEEDFSDHRNEENIFRYFHDYHIQGLLQRLDSCTMQYSVEARPPFLDHKLIDFVYEEIPYSLKLKWKSEEARQKAKGLKANQYSEELDTPKYILKKIAERYLDNENIYRKKMGFPVPLNSNFENIQVLAGELLKGSSVLNIRDYDEFLMDTKSLSNYGQLLWMCVGIEKFAREYFDKNWKY